MSPLLSGIQPPSPSSLSSPGTYSKSPRPLTDKTYTYTCRQSPLPDDGSDPRVSVDTFYFSVPRHHQKSEIGIWRKRVPFQINLMVILPPFVSSKTTLPLFWVFGVNRVTGDTTPRRDFGTLHQQTFGDYISQFRNPQWSVLTRPAN